jgi:hypothetical protein
VNENDTVVVDELKLGDNDRLAAMVSHLVAAGMLVILTDTKGLFSADPRIDDDAELLTAVRHTDEILDELFRSSGRGALGSGGVTTKIAAARMAAWSGVPTVIAEARNEDAAMLAVSGAEIGTWIAPHAARLSARKLWIAFGLPPEGKVVIDDGAVSALVTSGRSLLPVGVVAVEGTFGEGSAVEVFERSGDLIGKGLAGLSAHAVRESIGAHSSVAGGVVIHRDNCGNVAGFRKQPEKWIPAVWEKQPNRTFSSEVKVHVSNRMGVLAQVAAQIAAQETNIDHVNVTAEGDETSMITLEIEVRDRSHLARVLRAIKGMPDVLAVERSLA